jgi:hypothetical protein
LKRKLTQAETREVLSLKDTDINMKLLKDYFAVSLKQKEPRYNTTDTLMLPKGTLNNEEMIETTIGRYIFNLYVLPQRYLNKFGYQNVEYNTGNIKTLESRMDYMLMEDQLDTKEFAQFLDRAEWLTMGTAYFLSPTMNYDINVPIPEVMKRKEELFNQYKEEIAKGDPNVAELIERELVDMAKKILKEKGNEAYDFFLSGEFDFGNNYKKTSIFGGALENPYTKKLSILKSNYIDGISKDEFHHFANLTIIGGYSRNVETQKGGYETKKINNATQVITLDERESDCGTTQYLKVTIPESMKSMFINRWVLDGSKLVLLDENNISKFVGKETQMRSPLLCKTAKICGKCAGESFYKLGITNAGLLSTTLSGNLMNMSMKKFHNTSLKFSKINVDNFIKER